MATHQFLVNNRHVQNCVSVSVLQIRIRLLDAQEPVAVKLLDASRKGERVLSEVQAAKP